MICLGGSGNLLSSLGKQEEEQGRHTVTMKQMLDIQYARYLQNMEVEISAGRLDR